MWGICLENIITGGINLYQRAVEYQLASDKRTANILRPVKGIKISSDRIMTPDKPPVFQYGELVSPVDHPDRIGTVGDIIWHFKNIDYNYYITVDGGKKSKRYGADDLMKRIS